MRERISGRGKRGGAGFVGVAQEEFARLQRRARTGRRNFARTLNRGLRQSVTVAEVVVRMIERRCRLQIERRERFHAWELGGVLLVLSDAALALRNVPGEEDDDGMEIRTRQAAHPVVGVVRARVAENLRSGGHALLEPGHSRWYHR